MNEIQEIKLLRQYGRDPETGKPYPIGKVLKVGKDIPKSEVERILRLKAGIPYKSTAGLMPIEDHEAKVKALREKVLKEKKEKQEIKDLLIKVLKKADLSNVHVPELKEVATLLGVEGLGNAKKDQIIAAIQEALGVSEQSEDSEEQ
ncbi:hypothetical protein BBF96_03485 [Anoxybacter fermentans]|uniref:Rho termination factor-like N-terminal domain-containing protein n=1 Tax=Anoxybacter fermentans TaxID=1323375 RepID=A0A3Q9HP92_9FIRM|nr:Rho termination factor N-terminal domain-containing protein [Anoxybacter fermentans]AZR72525.1 hypothetical protein BBF96_03485 [Anoxybacter fermentans]